MTKKELDNLTKAYIAIMKSMTGLSAYLTLTRPLKN